MPSAFTAFPACPLPAARRPDSPKLIHPPPPPGLGPSSSPVEKASSPGPWSGVYQMQRPQLMREGLVGCELLLDKLTHLSSRSPACGEERKARDDPVQRDETCVLCNNASGKVRFLIWTLFFPRKAKGEKNQPQLQGQPKKTKQAGVWNTENSNINENTHNFNTDLSIPAYT